MIELVLADGSLYTIDARFIVCISRLRWKNLDAAAKNVCTIQWAGGGQVHLAGIHYEELIKLWQQKRESYLEQS